MKTPSVRVGVIGTGGMGTGHCRAILDGKAPGLELTATCDPARADAPFPGVPHYQDAKSLISAGVVEAVIIATPHYSHVPLGIQALEAGLHVLVEKPIAVHKADAERLLAAHRHRDRQIFGAVFNLRSHPAFLKLRQLIASGELGAVHRIQWTVTDWFRTNAYYASGQWRATWEGEGGGLLLNQCPHNLDIFQWLFGMPARVRGFCQLGRYHPIEVEDDVTAYFELPSGATAVFIASTGEAPGTNRLEVAADRGRVVLEGGRIHFTRTEVPVSEFCRTSSSAWSGPPVWKIEIPVEAADYSAMHAAILKNFAGAILRGEELIAPAAEGIHSVELANAILLSSLENRTIELPLDAAAYEKTLQELIAASRARRQPPSSPSQP